VLPASSETSDTASSSSGGEEDDKCPFFVKSQKITPHAVEHFAEQVIMGGTHSFHDTANAESRHPACVQKAAARARTYSDHNLSASKMLDYILDSMLLGKIVEIATGNMKQTMLSRYVLGCVYSLYVIAVSNHCM
jgi:hypothetical protein